MLLSAEAHPNPTSDNNVSGTADSAASNDINRRALDRKVHKKAVELNHSLRIEIEACAKELGVEYDKLSQKFALIAPAGETRAATWWNGLVSEYAEKWKSEYTGNGKGFLPWVARRIKESGVIDTLTEEDIKEYTEKANQKRQENKETRTAGMGRTKALMAAKEEIDDIHTRLQRLNRQLGIEFSLFTTRGSVNDCIDPMYLASDKARTFLQGHLSLPAKELLTLMDLAAIGGLDVVGLANKVAGDKETHRRAVRNKLHASFCHAARSNGYDTSKVKKLCYSKYGKLVYNYEVILRGYPLTKDGKMVRVSDFPGGIQGLLHAQRQLESGTWGFEQIAESVYKDWKVRRDEAQASNEALPLPPHIAVPGSEFKKMAGPGNANDPGPSTRTSTQLKRKGSNGTVGRKAKKPSTTSTKKSFKGKSKEFIEDSDPNDSGTPDLGDSEEFDEESDEEF